jgi:cell division initiation protein
MRITPLDIRKQPFRRAFRGFDTDAVNSFLEMVANEFEGIIQQNNDYAGRIKRLEEKCEGYTKIERTLNETLLTAQKLSDDARVSAQKEAELIIKEATVRAGEEENDIRRRTMQLEKDMASLKNQRDSFLARFKGLLTTQLDLLDVISGDLQDNGGTTDEDNGAKGDDGKDAARVGHVPDVGEGEDTAIADPPRFSLS